MNQATPEWAAQTLIPAKKHPSKQPEPQNPYVEPARTIPTLSMAAQEVHKIKTVLKQVSKKTELQAFNRYQLKELNKKLDLSDARENNLVFPHSFSIYDRMPADLKDRTGKVSSVILNKYARNQ
jgi:hypothetical protein